MKAEHLLAKKMEQMREALRTNIEDLMRKYEAELDLMCEALSAAEARSSISHRKR